MRSVRLMRLPFLACVCAGLSVGGPLSFAAGETPTLRASADNFAIPHKPSVRLFHNLQYREGVNSCRLDLAIANDQPKRPRPTVVVIHGGGWLEGDKSSFASDDRRMPGNIVELARSGFTAATINYRLSGEAKFPAAFHDCQCAIRWLRTHASEYQIDPNRIGVYGNSAGGHLALLLGLVTPAAGLDEPHGPYSHQSSQVQAAGSDSGPIDLALQAREGAIKQAVIRFMGSLPDGSRLADYRRASPESYTSAKTPPLLLIYGEADEQVLVGTADRFVEALNRSGRQDVSYFRLAKVGHCPHSMQRVPFLRQLVIDFFLRTLRKP